MKKLTALLLAGALCVGLAACGTPQNAAAPANGGTAKTEGASNGGTVRTEGTSNGAAVKTDEASNSSSGQGTAPGKSEKTVIEYWHCNAETQGGLTVEELVNRFNEENDHIEVVARYNPDMYKGLMQNLQAEAAVGNSPAVVQIGWAFLDYFSNNFAYTPPQEAIDRFDENDKTFLSDNFLPNVLELAVNSNGEQVGIPYSLSSPVLYINRDLLKEAGLNPDGPATWEEVREFAKTIKEKTGKYGFYMQEPADFWAQQAYIESRNTPMLTEDADGRKLLSFATREGIDAMQMYADMVAEGSALHISWEEGCQSFIDGNCAMLYTTIARRAVVQSGAQFDVASVKSPLWEGCERKVPAGGCFLAITAQGDEQTAAVEQMDSVVPWTAFPGDAGLQAEQMLLDMRDQILGGQISAEEGMTATQDAINALLLEQ